MFAKRYFYRWRRAVQSARDQTGVAESARLTAADDCWNDEDMNHFLSTAGSWDEHARLHQAEKEARRDRRHENHKNEMPLLIPPSLLRLWQIKREVRNVTCNLCYLNPAISAT